jgi:RNA polymerase sigma factor (sigma-70 family)
VALAEDKPIENEIVNEYAIKGIENLTADERQKFDKQLSLLIYKLLNKSPKFRFAILDVQNELFALAYCDLIQRLLDKKFDPEKASFVTYSGHRLIGVVSKYERKSDSKCRYRRNLTNTIRIPDSLDVPFSENSDGGASKLDMVSSHYENTESDSFMIKQLLEILTPQELLIARMKAMNKSNNAIGREIDISGQAVKNQILKIRKKLTTVGLTPDLFNQN